MPPLHHDHVLSNGCMQRCIQCDLLFNLPVLHKKQRAYCPRCRAKIAMGQDWSLNRLMVIVIAMLVLMPFAFCSPLISIRLLGTWIDASLFSGIWQISRQGDPFTASMVAFCTIGAPLILSFSLLYLTLGSRMGLNLTSVRDKPIIL